MSDYEVIALGTGSKCLGENNLSLDGSLIHDGHAEVVSKRALVIYFLHQLEKAYETKMKNMDYKDLKFEYCEKNKCFSMKENVKFHFYSSCPPCGDATIAPKKKESECLDTNELSPLYHKAKRLKYEEDFEINDIHRTGAKCLDICERKDSLLKAENLTDYHVLGAIRRKPGRGDPTASLSCSDKLAKWNFVGIQGSFLSSLLPNGPILWSSMIFSGTNIDIESVKRSMFGRFTNHDSYLKSVPIIHSSVCFPYNKNNISPTERQLFPCSSNIAFSQSDKKVLCHDIMVEGRKQGIVKKHFGTPKERVAICRYNVGKRFKNLATNIHQNCIDKTICEMCISLLNNVHYIDLKIALQNLSGWYEKRLNAFYNILPGLKEERLVRRKRIDTFHID